MNKTGDDVDINVVTSSLPSSPLSSNIPSQPHSSYTCTTGLCTLTEPINTFPLKSSNEVDNEESEIKSEVYLFDCDKERLVSDDTHGQEINTRIKKTIFPNELNSFVDRIVLNALESLKAESHRICLLEKGVNESKMGNKQTSVKTAGNDEDTPEEGKCCQVPKKKIKNKAKRTSRGSRGDDLAFDSHEVYPFERGSLTEQELSEPVELEPFEIVDTDDIRFVPGAGTSDVIKSVSEPKFTTIPEEVILEENEESLQAVTSSSVEGNKQFYIEKGNRLIEPGTSTAHSTFEFKQVKPTTGRKLPVPQPEEQTEPLYENIPDTPKTDHNKPSTSSEGALSKSPSDSVGSSREVSRKNSKEAIQKPLRKSKKGKEGTDNKTNVKETVEPPLPDKPKQVEKQNKPRVKRGDKPAIRDSEIDRNIDSVFMLTQTMFSKLKKPEEELTKPPDQDKDIDSSLFNPELKYENVNVCVKLEPTGLAIAHKETKQLNEANGVRKKLTGKQEIQSGISDEPTGPEQLNYENVGVVAKIEPKGITLGHKGGPPPKCVNLVEQKKDKKDKKGAKSSKDSKKKRKASDDKEFVQISRQNSSADAQHGQGILHISDSGTLIIKADKTETKVAKQCENGCSTNNELDSKPANREDVPDLPPPKITANKRGMLHISDTGTLIIHSLPQPPVHAPSSEQGINHYYENDIIDRDITDIKVPYEEIDEVLKQDPSSMQLSAEEEKRMLAKQIEETKVKDEDVPPPSPSTMDILEEEEEDEEEVFEDAEDKRKSAEIIEFTESVCKRLSQYLESQTSDNEEEEIENEDYLFESGAFENNNDEAVAENYYETLTEKKWNNYDNFSAPMSLQGPQSYDNVRAEMGTKDSLQPTSFSLTESESTSTLKRTSGDSDTYKTMAEPVDIQKSSQSSEDGLPEYFDPLDRTSLKFRVASQSDELSGEDKRNGSPFAAAPSYYESLDPEERILSKQMTLPLRTFDTVLVKDTPQEISSKVDDIIDRTPTAETVLNLTPLAEMATAQESNQVQFETGSGRRSVTCTESDLDISEHRDDLSTDSMLADDEEEETMDILFSKTYTEPEEGAEVFLSCTVVNSAYKDENKKSDTWLSDEALEYLEANASDVMSLAFMKAKREMKDIQVCLQSLRKQMEHFHGDDRDDISLPDIPVEQLSPDYFGLPRKAITD